MTLPYLAATLPGMILLHATCVAIDGLGVVLRGRPGAGKSDLALRLIDEGASLVADDYCEIEIRDGRLHARAPASIAGKMEIRGVGIVARDYIATAPVALVIDLQSDRDIPRLPDVTTMVIENATIAWIALDPFTVSATAKVRAVLAARTQETKDAPYSARVLTP